MERTCNICGERMSTPSKDDLSGFIKHGNEYHPDYFLTGTAKSRTYKFAEKKYFNPITEEWFSNRQYLARSITKLGMTNEEYYLTYGEQYMQDEWTSNSNDDVLGDAHNHKHCIECGKELKFNQMKWMYPAFCCNSKCNVNWYNKNTNRHEKAGKSLSTTLLENGDISPTQLGYWLKKGYSEEEAKEHLYNRQNTNSLEKFQERYGVEEGKQKWAERQEKWLKSLDDNGWFSSHSKISEQLFDTLSTYIPDLCYGKNELSVRLGNSVKRPDCVKRGEKNIIEFNGDYFHANPTKYKPTDIMRRLQDGVSVTAEYIWKKDKKRLDLFEQYGFNVLVIWESDYRNDAEMVINKCLEHLKVK